VSQSFLSLLSFMLGRVAKENAGLVRDTGVVVVSGSPLWTGKDTLMFLSHCFAFLKNSQRVFLPSFLGRVMLKGWYMVQKSGSAKRF
jgi:hypothetical protein